MRNFVASLCVCSKRLLIVWWFSLYSTNSLESLLFPSVQKNYQASLFIVAPIACVWPLLCRAVLSVLPSFVIISLGKRELITLLYLSSWCHVVLVLCDSFSLCRRLVCCVIVHFLVILTYLLVFYLWLFSLYLYGFNLILWKWKYIGQTSSSNKFKVKHASLQNISMSKGT